MEAASRNDNLHPISEIGINKMWVTLNGSSKQKWQLTYYKWDKNKQNVSDIKWKQQ
jgi:hypothetical protein